MSCIISYKVSVDKVLELGGCELSETGRKGLG